MVDGEVVFVVVVELVLDVLLLDINMFGLDGIVLVCWFGVCVWL